MIENVDKLEFWNVLPKWYQVYNILNINIVHDPEGVRSKSKLKKISESYWLSEIFLLCPPEIYRNNGSVWTHVKTPAGLFVGFLYRKEKPTFYIFYCFSINNPVLYGIWSIVWMCGRQRKIWGSFRVSAMNMVWSWKNFP